ncbi:MAG: hypothetical protein GX879_05050, partial [Bacteroidales bacterium]|nr:hypothetical protein [Bacteroidales bacterium]
MKNILFLSLFLLSFGLVAQEVAIDIAPSIIGNYSKTFFDKLQTKNLENNNDTLELPFFDDFSNSFVYPNQSFWDGCAAFINNNYAIDPISIGVASLDAIDSTGAVYSHFPFSASVVAENLTSRPINLNYSPADSIYLSFYYQCGGKGDTPEKNDSLLLEFSTPNTDWKTIWAVEGGTNMNYFQQVILPITDTIFLEKGFRFRFKNYASLGSNYEPSFNSNFDVWNIDYVRLDTARSVYDTINQDVAFVSNFSSMLKEYEAIPWEHFKPFASENTIDSLVYLYKNNGTHTQNINRQLVIKDLWGSGTGFSSLDDSENILAGETIHYAKQVNYIFNSTTADSACFEMKGFIKTDTTEARRAFRWNDTIRYQQKFLNYYSYDDASAESGYGIAGQGTSDAAVALKFNILKPDTLRGVNMFFNQVLNQANQNYFYLMVWANNNGIPGDTIV